MHKTIFILAILCILTASCAKDKVQAFVVDPNCSDTISFAQKIQPLINQNCSTSGCHDAATQTAGYNFTNFANVASQAEIMLKTMRSESGVTPMPLNGTMLQDSLIQQFSCWVSQGKLEN